MADTDQTMAADQADIVIPSAISGPPPSLKKKKKRSLPGTPDPEAEVIVLSPATLLATNRYVCEMCGKGFQREQNLQLHRRGHNLPWKLRHRAAEAVRRKRVYVCPELSCVHHHPSRALGDLTGIKKHYCRKHGHEKRWRCHKCGKRYAVQSDCKAHAKTCGTREYRCHCGTFFARKDSFTTHRAFCDVLAMETANMISSLTSSFCNSSSACNFMESSMSPAKMEQTYNSILEPSINGEPDHLQGSSAFIYSNGGHQSSWMRHDKLAEQWHLVSEMKNLQNSGILSLNNYEGGLVEMNPSSFEIESGSNGTMERAVELTRDFLGVDAPAIAASSSLNGWTRVGI